jgi:hypothetical protein
VQAELLQFGQTLLELAHRGCRGAARG